MLSLTGALFFARHGFVLALFAATCLVLGRRLLRGVDPGSLGEELALSTGLGLGVVGTALFAVGALGLLTRSAVLFGFLLVHAGCWATWRELLRRMRSTRFSAIGSGWPWFPAAAVLAVAAVLSCYPPTGFDATLYHLPYARAFARLHGLVVLPELRFPIFPQMTELHFSALLLVGDDIAAQGVELLALAACLALLAGWASRKSRGAGGPWAASAWVGCPAVALLAACAYVDLSFTLFVLLAYLAWERWREDGGRAWLALSAVFAAFSAATKYHGLFVAALLGAMTLWDCLRRRRGGAPVGIFAVLFLAVASPWYVRIILATGNPVFPFLPRIFGSSPYSLAIDAVTPGGTAGVDATLTASRAIREWLGAPLRVAGSILGVPNRAGQTPLSPFIALLCILAAAAAFRNPSVRRALLFAGAYAVACGGAEVRFLLPAAALLAYAGSVALAQASSRGGLGSTTARAVIAAAFVLPGAAWGTHRLFRLGPVPVRPAERGAYLRRMLPPYAAIEYLNRSRGSDYTVYSAGAENLVYFADGRSLGDWFGPNSYGRILGFPIHDAATLDSNLRSIGAGYLLWNFDRMPFRIREDDDFQRHFLRRLRGPGFALYERVVSPGE